eukprot:4738356-Pyramimonas_sp.AAC.1
MAVVARVVCGEVAKSKRDGFSEVRTPPSARGASALERIRAGAACGQGRFVAEYGTQGSRGLRPGAAA